MVAGCWILSESLWRIEGYFEVQQEYTFCLKINDKLDLTTSTKIR